MIGKQFFPKLQLPQNKQVKPQPSNFHEINSQTAALALAPALRRICRGSSFRANIYQGEFPVENGDAGEDGFKGIAPTAQYPPNPNGLHDMSGNVWEWCSDWYRVDTYANRKTIAEVTRNPQGPPTPRDPAESDAKMRVQRGGSFLCTSKYCSRYITGTRGKGEVSTASNHLGFRCVIPIKAAPLP